MRSVRAIGLAIGTIAVLSGAAFLWVAGAGSGMAIRNPIAFAIGLMLGAIGLAVQPPKLSPFLPRFLLTVTMLAIVLAVGVSVDGVQRWIRLGPVTLQPALILLPTLFTTIAADRRDQRRSALLVPDTLRGLSPDTAATAADRGAWRRIALLIPAGLVAFQPDAGTSAALAAALWVLWLADRSRLALLAAFAASAVAGWSMVALATPAPVPFVENTTELALAQGPLATVLHTAAILLMLLPFWIVRRDGGGPLLAFFAALVVASILAPFPMPLAGGAVSPLVGYGAALALLFLPIRRRIRRP